VQSAYWKRQTYFEGIVGSCIPGAMGFAGYASNFKTE
jgi:hypothetical protein